MILPIKHTQYESEITKFIKDLKEKSPQLEERQREGWSLLWNKVPTDLDTQERIKASRVKQQAYVYQNKG